MSSEDRDGGDGAVASNAVADSAVAGSAGTNSAVANSAVADRTTADSAVSDRAVSDRAVSDSAVSDSAVSDSTAAPASQDTTPPAPAEPPALTRWGTAGVGALALLGAGAMIAAIWGGIDWITSDARQAAGAFVDHVRASDEPGAYALTSASLRAKVPPNGLWSYLATHAPDVRRATAASVGAAWGGLAMLCVRVELEGPAGSSSDAIVVTVKEGDVWRVRSISSDYPPECESDPD